ncbi:MAG: DNA (cytosine-5-)-methyltransferase [Alphaproteobacteria bacterium]
MDAKPLRYLSICSGIEAATVAWHPLGFEAAGFSEIDPFARAVLVHHYPDVPLFGDFTTLTEHDYGGFDLLVGGTPCQSFSIAGLRKGLADDRGNLALGFIRLAQMSGARWVVWENVPGVLSIDRGRTFATFLGALAECGYGFAYRVLDAQYFGVPQRRRRVFVIGYLGDWRPAAAVLFERESLQRDLTPRRETRQNTAGTLGARTCRSIGAQDAECGHLIAKTLMGCGAKHDAELETYVLDKQKQWPADVACTLNAQYGDKMGLEDQHALAGAPLFVPARAYNVTYCDANGRRKDRPNGGMYVNETEQSKTITAGGDRSTYIAFSAKDYGADAGETAPTLRAMGHSESHANGGGQIAVAIPLQEVGKRTGVSTSDTSIGSGIGNEGDAMFTLQASARHGVATFEPGSVARNAGPSRLSDAYSTLRANMGDNQPAVLSDMAVRRLTPRECERLQGFADDYTLIPYRGKQAADGPRYKALGNSMAVPVMRWLGERIKKVNAMI